MIRDVQKNVTTLYAISTGNKRVLYRLYEFFNTFIPTSLLVGKFTIVDADAAGGDWLSETGPGDGAFFVVQCETPYLNDATKKWQVLFGCRETTGAIGGYAALAAGSYLNASQQGGWNAVTKVFDLPNTACQKWTVSPTSIGAVTKMHIIGWERGLAMVMDHAQDGTWDLGFQVQELVSRDSELRPLCMSKGAPKPLYDSYSWGYSTGGNGFSIRADETGYDAATIDYTTTMLDGKGMSKKDNRYIEYPIIFFNITQNKMSGVLREIRRCSNTIAAETEIEIVEGGGTVKRVCFNGLTFPWV